MPDKGNSKNVNPTPGSNTAVESSPSETETTPAPATESSPAWETKPKGGKVTADETKRFLAEIVASRSLSKVGDKIALAVNKIEPGEPGGILIVDNLSWAASDISYRDLLKKLEMLLKWSQDVEEDCQNFLKPKFMAEIIKRLDREKGDKEEVLELKTKILEHVTGLLTRKMEVTGEIRELLPPVEGETKEVQRLKEEIAKLLDREDEENQLSKGFGPSSISSGLGGLVPLAAGVTSGLQAIGDIIGYFRTDYEIKGQTLANTEDLYIQAIVAEDLIRNSKDVYLLNFNFISQSKLIEKLGNLFEQKYKILTCTEKIKSEFVDGTQARIEALETHLASLKAKLTEYLVNVDDDIIDTLKTRIGDVEDQLKVAHARRTPDTQITGLETHLSSLRTKLVDELIEDTPAAIAAVRDEIKETIKKLENKDAPDTNLTDVEVKAHNDLLKLLQTKLTDLIAGSSNNTRGILKAEIEKVRNQLRVDQNTRVSDSQISGLETHLADLRTKLVECLVRNDNDARDNLQIEITNTEQDIDRLRKSMGVASGIVNKSTKVNDAIDAFISTITTIPTGGSYPPFVTACIREHLDSKKIRYILKIKLMSSGADFIKEDPPFYSRAVKTSYMGGGVVSYVMAEREGRIVASGTVDGVSALEHRIGKEPQLLEWRIRTRDGNTPGRMTSLYLNALIASSILYMFLALIGAVPVSWENSPPPIYSLIIQAIFTYLATRRDQWGTFGVVGLTILGLLFTTGMLANLILSEISGPQTIQLINAVLGISLIIVPFTMMILGIHEWTRRGAKK